jgi:hypothetical protein
MRIVRNFGILKGRPYRPIRSEVCSAGPGLVTITLNQMSARTGDNAISPNADAKMSNARFRRTRSLPMKEAPWGLDVAF